MPTKRFEKLKSKKKQLILDSIKDCLEKKDISSISVKDIADEAEISRGTFYTYFTDIKDCVFTLIIFYLNQFFENLKVAANNNNGNFMKTIREEYKTFMDFLSNEKAIVITRNLGSAMNIKMAVDYYTGLNKYSNDIYNWFSKETDIGRILKEKYKVFSLLSLLNSAMMTAIIELSIGIDRKNIDKETFFKFDVLANSFKK